MMKLGILSLTCIICTIPSWAVKAKPGLIDYKQSDGTVIKIQIHGDEQFNYITDAAGNLLQITDDGKVTAACDKEKERVALKTTNGRFYKSSRNFATRSSGDAKYRYSTSAFPTKGEPHSLVILVEYPDHGFNVADPKEYFDDFLNGDNFKRDRATGSVKSFFTENSYGAFVPTYDVYGPVMLAHNRIHYGAGYNDTYAYEMVIEAVEALDEEVDFSQYDHNDDGFVDSVYLIYSDKGQADGGPTETVWPYSWELVEEGVTLIADGVQFNTYGVSNELQSDGQMAGIGTFTHEFGHVLGLPDLYNTENSGDHTTPEDWSLMDSGSYLNDCRTPPNLSSFERYSLGWLSPDLIYTSGSYSLEPLPDSHKAYIIPSEENEDEFFMLEYRWQEGWDKYLPYHGMLVWHIDFVQAQWDLNTVNNNNRHQYVELIRADNTKNVSTFAGDPFPGVVGVTSFSNNTTPALLTWLKHETNVTSIYDIEESESKVTFKAETREERVPTGVGSLSEAINFSIIDKTVYVEEGIHYIYDISGRQTGIVTPDKPISLDNGIYILAGKKILVK